MAFQTSLSGLNAAQANLSVTGNNIANASTNGFKKSRAEFADIYTSSFGGAGSTAIGGGVQLADVSQQFVQGNVEFTESGLDLAVSGEGFFTLRDTDNSILYTRAGAYSVDRSGYVVNSNGQRLQSYSTDTSGTVTNFTPVDLQLSTGTNPAQATTTVDISLNLDASVSTVTPTLLDPATPSTYNFSTSTTVYDSLGGTHTATLYFQKALATSEIDSTGNLDSTTAVGGTVTSNLTVYDSLGNASNPATTFITYTKTANPNEWTANLTVDGVLQPDTITFDFTAGSTSPALVGATSAFSNVDLGNGGIPSNVTLDFSGLTETIAATSINSPTTTNNSPLNTWNTVMTVDGTTFDSEVLTFNSNGSLATAPSAITYNDSAPFIPTNGAGPLSLTIDYGTSTQFAGSSSVNSLVQDGFTTGRLSGIDIDNRGVVFTRFTNGQSSILGAVAMAQFSNPQGLQQVGDTNWAQTFESGDVVAGQAGTGTFGQIQSGALESSNVDLSQQLVNMIVAQRDYQANAKMISTEDAVTQTIINIR